MPSKKLQGNRPDRRIWPDGPLDVATATDLVGRCRYVGAAFHKTKRSDYGLEPPTSLHPHKSPCDDIRPIKKAEASALLEAGIRRGLVSAFGPDTVPKYIWAVDKDGEVYEAKTKPRTETAYHGYRLGSEDRFRRYVLKTWRARDDAAA